MVEARSSYKSAFHSTAATRRRIHDRSSPWSRLSASTSQQEFKTRQTGPQSPFATTRLRASMSMSMSMSMSTTEPEQQQVQVPKKFVPVPFGYREELTVRVSSLTNLGVGVCRVPYPAQHLTSEREQGEEATDWVIMVPTVIPGELIKVRVFRNHKTYSDADLLEVLEPSPHRISEPPCPLFATCGGCQYQHMDIQIQREWKTNQVKELLQRVAEFSPCPEVTPTVGTDEIYHYRSKITPHYDKPLKIDVPQSEPTVPIPMENVEKIRAITVIGFKQKTKRSILDVPYCHIATEAINEKLTQVRTDKMAEAAEGRLARPNKGATLLLRDTAEQGVVTDHNLYVTAKVKDLTFRFLAGNFFQNNPFMLPIMVDKVVHAATIMPSSNRKMTHLIDCYCGSGLFCLTAAQHFETCVGIEINNKAIDEATANAQLNGIENCAFIAASAEAIFESNADVRLPSQDKEMNGGDDDDDDDDDNNDQEGELGMIQKVRDFPRGETVVVLDPPRKGCSEEFLEQLYAFGPQRIVYMSCDPATQARDSRGIVNHGYEVVSVQPFDLFPQTRHIECLMVFEKINE